MKPRIYITTYKNTGRYMIEKVVNYQLDTIFFSIDRFIEDKLEPMEHDNIDYLDTTYLKILRFKNTKLFYEI